MIRLPRTYLSGNSLAEARLAVPSASLQHAQPIASPHQDAAEPTCHEEAAPAGARFVDDVAVVDAVAVAGEAADGVFRGILDVELAGAQQLAAQTPLVGEDPGGIRPQDAAAHGDAPTLALPYLQEGGLYGGGVCGRQERRVGAS